MDLNKKYNTYKILEDIYFDGIVIPKGVLFELDSIESELYKDKIKLIKYRGVPTWVQDPQEVREYIINQLAKFFKFLKFSINSKRFHKLNKDHLNKWGY